MSINSTCCNKSIIKLPNGDLMCSECEKVQEGNKKVEALRIKDALVNLTMLSIKNIDDQNYGNAKEDLMELLKLINEEL